MKKAICILFLFLLAGMCSFGLAEELVEGVTVTENAESITGYRATFGYKDAKATDVRLVGNFLFYAKDDVRLFTRGYFMRNLKGYSNASEGVYTPSQWKKELNLRHFRNAAYTRDMIYDEARELWTTSLDLPCASYTYYYSVSYDDGNTFDVVSDPANVPAINNLGTEQSLGQFYVPFNPDKQTLVDDWTWLFPVEDSEYAGEIVSCTYASPISDASPLLVYLPAHYDAARAQPYKVLYLSHGGGGEEGDWFHQGNAANIVDRLTMEGACEEFIFVTMDNTAFEWDFDTMFDNYANCLIPFVEANFNVSKQKSDRALAGLSMGGRSTCEMLWRDPAMFGYFGVWSSAAAYSLPKLDDYSIFEQANIHLAAGFSDFMLGSGSTSKPDTGYRLEDDRTVMGLADALNEIGVTYNDGEGVLIVDGEHDWFTWPLILREYITTTLWK